MPVYSRELDHRHKLACDRQKEQGCYWFKCIMWIQTFTATNQHEFISAHLSPGLGGCGGERGVGRGCTNSAGLLQGWAHKSKEPAGRKTDGGKQMECPSQIWFTSTTTLTQRISNDSTPQKGLFATLNHNLCKHSCFLGKMHTQWLARLTALSQCHDTVKPWRAPGSKAPSHSVLNADQIPARPKVSSSPVLMSKLLVLSSWCPQWHQVCCLETCSLAKCFPAPQSQSRSGASGLGPNSGELWMISHKDGRILSHTIACQNTATTTMKQNKKRSENQTNPLLLPLSQPQIVPLGFHVNTGQGCE